MSGRPAPDRPDWCATFTLTARCLAVAKALGDADRAVSTQDYELYALAFDPARDKELKHFLSSTIGPLLDYDRRRSTDLLPTLARTSTPPETSPRPHGGCTSTSTPC